MSRGQDSADPKERPPRSTRVDKRRALLDGALLVFAEDGYTRASIDTIARRAGVSTRTIYNQFGDKAALFEAVIVDSARRTADEQIATVRRYLGKIVDIEDDLIEFGRVWASPAPEHAPHFALVRQIHADAGHIAETTLRAWQEVGPLRVRKEIAEHLSRIATAGHLTVTDADLAAVHLVQLIAGDITTRTYHGAIPLPVAELHRLSDAGVRAFLHGHISARH
ncbi:MULTISPECIES: TetR/AcrR family transcriptional regulator [Microbacteriaceae]|uniref:TetR/AcrR family transcriptional regulator n=1 Tax=Leucobacter weissii TaxID=1983706 RepID=A0A939MN70_9MICO|nr:MULTISPECIES: TetR/AcrR family transcriptional regulator [Microbacteriaceae]MBO1902940.1 TetR/AcrR family transcriptional regulator [Leucobacter weissii]